jgi:hypothetical protein
MKTSSFFHYDGVGRISIARFAPKGTSGHKIYRSLAPGKWFKEYNNFEDYKIRYEKEILAPLNPEIVYNQLNNLVAPYEPVLLCWEHLVKEDDWCHRRIVADWFEKTLGVKVPELKPQPKKPKKSPQESLF